MNIQKALKRDKANQRKRYGMRISGASVKQLPEILAKKSKKKTGV